MVTFHLMNVINWDGHAYIFHPMNVIHWDGHAQISSNECHELGWTWSHFI
jgi:hypothetical protein